MTIVISSELQDRLRALAAASPQLEVCGLLVGSGNCVAEVRSCANVAADRARKFEIDPVALFAAIRAEREGGAGVIGYFHSHPGGSAIPSKTDAESAIVDGRVWIIVAGSELAAWKLTQSGFDREVIASN